MRVARARLLLRIMRLQGLKMPPQSLGRTGTGAIAGRETGRRPHARCPSPSPESVARQRCRWMYCRHCAALQLFAGLRRCQSCHRPQPCQCPQPLVPAPSSCPCYHRCYPRHRRHLAYPGHHRHCDRYHRCRHHRALSARIRGPQTPLRRQTPTQTMQKRLPWGAWAAAAAAPPRARRVRASLRAPQLPPQLRAHAPRQPGRARRGCRRAP